MNLKKGSIQLTYCDGHVSALLTVRGKDHDLQASELRTLAKAASEAADAIEHYEAKAEAHWDDKASGRV